MGQVIHHKRLVISGHVTLWFLIALGNGPFTYHCNWWQSLASTRTPFQRGRLTRLNVWGFVVQCSLCSWSFSCLHCVSDLTQVFVAGASARVCWLYFTNFTACLSDSCMGTACLVSGHETAKFRTNDVASHQKGCQARWALDTWCLVHVGQVDRAARVAYLNRSDQFCALRRQIVEQSDALHLSSLMQTILLRISTAVLWPSPYVPVPGMLRLLFWWPSLGWPAWCVCAHHGQIHFCLPCAGVAFLARTSRGKVNSCAPTGFCLGKEHSRLDLRASSLDNTYPWPLHMFFFCFGMLCNQVLRPCDLAWNRLDTCYLGMSENIMSGFSQTMLGSPSISGLWMTWRSLVIGVPFGFVPGLP